MTSLYEISSVSAFYYCIIEAISSEAASTLLYCPSIAEILFIVLLINFKSFGSRSQAIRCSYYDWNLPR